MTIYFIFKYSCRFLSPFDRKSLVSEISLEALTGILFIGATNHPSFTLSNISLCWKSNDLNNNFTIRRYIRLNNKRIFYFYFIFSLFQNYSTIIITYFI